MAKGNLPNTNTQSTSNSVGLNKMENTGNQAPWQQLANSGVSYPMGLVKQGPLGPFGTVNTPLNMPPMQMPQQRPLDGMPVGNAMPRGGGNMMQQQVMPPQNNGLMPSPDVRQEFMPRMIG